MRAGPEGRDVARVCVPPAVHGRARGLRGRPGASVLGVPLEDVLWKGVRKRYAAVAGLRGWVEEPALAEEDEEDDRAFGVKGNIEDGV